MTFRNTFTVLLIWKILKCSVLLWAVVPIISFIKRVRAVFIWAKTKTQSDWLSRWREFFKPITERSKVKPISDYFRYSIENRSNLELNVKTARCHQFYYFKPGRNENESSNALAWPETKICKIFFQRAAWKVMKEVWQYQNKWTILGSVWLSHWMWQIIWILILQQSAQNFPRKLSLAKEISPPKTSLIKVNHPLYLRRLSPLRYWSC